MISTKSRTRFSHSLRNPCKFTSYY